MRVLILEDNDARIREFQRALHTPLICETVEEAKALFTKYHDQIGVMSLDHDLGHKEMVASVGPEPTGYTFVQWLTQQVQPCGMRVIVHSFNPDGALNMVDLLIRYGWHATRCPFGPYLLNMIKLALISSDYTARAATEV